MSEALTIPPLADAPATRTPTVYFIDDSATMREVIKIAFRRESFNVVACADAASALAQFAQNPPDAVITDIIKLKTEIARLELLVKKLQTELRIERQYNQALEQHVHNLTTID